MLLEWDHESEFAIPLTEHPGATIKRFRHNGAPDELVQAIRAVDRDGWSTWIGAERHTVKAAKSASTSAGVSKSAIKAQAYWMRGRAPGATRSTNEATP